MKTLTSQHTLRLLHPRATTESNAPATPLYAPGGRSGIRSLKVNNPTEMPPVQTNLPAVRCSY